MSRREEAKAERRTRIIAAARELIRETGDTGLSMRAIAARANVSLATPYNLFGSKRAIVMAVFEDIRDFEQRYARVKDVDPIDRLFKALSITLSYHVEDPAFYKVLWSSLLDISGKELRTALITPQSQAFWRGLVQEAAANGVFDPEADLDIVLQDAGMTFTAVMLNWVLGALRDDEIEAAMGYGYAMSLCAAAKGEAREALWKRALEFQRKLQKARKRAAAA